MATYSSIKKTNPKLQSVFGILTPSNDIEIRKILDSTDKMLLEFAQFFGSNHAGWGSTGLDLVWFPLGQIEISSFVGTGLDGAHCVDFIVSLQPTWVYDDFPVGRRGVIEWLGKNGALAIQLFKVKAEEFEMISKKSPGGGNFPYYHKNGELFGAHYESFAAREQGVLELMRAEEDFIIKQNYPLPYWVNFYGTKLTNKVLSEFIQSINRLQRYIPKLAIVGCSVIDKWRVERIRKKTGMNIPVRYFCDPEDAKAWLVSEIY